jgi:hypothetical protein
MQTSWSVGTCEQPAHTAAIWFDPFDQHVAGNIFM